MLFTSPWFLLFAVVALSYCFTFGRVDAFRKAGILISSIIFYLCSSDIRSFVFILTMTVLTYGAAIALNGRRRRPVLVGALALLILSLIYFKYADFIIGGFGGGEDGKAILGLMNPGFVPLGISFFVFEFAHYIVDVHRGAAPIRDPLHFGIFALFYPRLAAGPIVRFHQIIPQLEALAPPRQSDIVIGLGRIIGGVAKKFLIADPVAELIAQRFAPGQIGGPTDLIGLALLLYVRIYMDFSGYSDMAIGLARLWGIKLPENFNFPFLACSPSHFWRRWHISLSSWVRDYIYIPLGGARVGVARKLLNLLAAMAICGLWHGAGWQFVVWGLLHGGFLIAGHLVRLAGRALSPARVIATPAGPPLWAVVVGKGLGWFVTQAAVMAAWLPFFHPVGEVRLIVLRAFHG